MAKVARSPFSDIALASWVKVRKSLALDPEGTISQPRHKSFGELHSNKRGSDDKLPLVTLIHAKYVSRNACVVALWWKGRTPAYQY